MRQQLVEKSYKCISKDGSIRKVSKSLRFVKES